MSKVLKFTIGRSIFLKIQFKKKCVQFIEYAIALIPFL